MHQREKLTEAEFFLELIRKSSATMTMPDTRYYTSAFLAAARSALQYAYKEAEDNGDQAWYSGWFTTWKGNHPVVAFLRDERNDDIHERPVQPIEKIEMTAEERMPAPSDAIPFPVSAGTSALGSKTTLRVEREFAFRNWGGNESLADVCALGLAALKLMIDDGVSLGKLTG